MAVGILDMNPDSALAKKKIKNTLKRIQIKQ